MPRYYIGQDADGHEKAIYFKVRHVSKKYWDEVVYPGLQVLAAKLKRKLIIYDAAFRHPEEIEFAFWKEEASK